MANSLIRHSLWMISLCLFATALTARAQEAAAEPKFVFDTGNPPWRGERIELPPGFAPDLGWKGVEQIRFAPGMFTEGEDDFFSYVLVFLLSNEAKTDKPTLEQEQRQGRALLWDKQIDRSFQPHAQSAQLAQKPYVYQNEH